MLYLVTLYLSLALVLTTILHTLSTHTLYQSGTGGTHKAWNQGGSDARMTTRTSENAFDMVRKILANVLVNAILSSYLMT